jgi:hypothetical protein
LPHGILRDVPVEDSDLVDAAHDAPHFRDRRPGKSFVRVKRLQPALKVEWFDVLRRLPAPPSNEVVADDVPHDGGRVFRLRAHGIFPEVGLEVVLGKGVEPDADRRGGIVDAGKQPERVHVTPCVPFPREVGNKTHRHGVFDPSAVRC